MGSTGIRGKYESKIRPITIKEANAYVNKYHRHHNATVGGKFAISCYSNNILCGVAICGRPVSRYLDNGEILEVNRVCTDGTKNACSMLYGACARIAKEMGYKKVITYILFSESGKSLIASNYYVLEKEEAGKEHWTGERYKQQELPLELKKRYAFIIKN